MGGRSHLPVRATARIVSSSYILPLRSGEPQLALGAYLDQLVSLVDEVIVVDGSDDEVFDAHAAAWPPGLRHLPVDGDVAFANGKVNGVVTGLRHARHDRVVIADDDVRYDAPALDRILSLLDDADVVIPQNYFASLPWHARWDTSRTLLNRAVSHDYPGTLAARRSLLQATDGYDGDVLFENLELIRTVAAAGGRVRNAPDLFVARIPPSAAHFRGQRLRQAYDSLAQPGRLAVELSLLPTALLARRSRWGLPLLAAALTAIAEVGRRRDGGAAVFPATAPLFAPAWTAERAVCIWLALGTRVFFGGARYSGTRLRVAANAPKVLRERHARAATVASRPKVTAPAA